MTKTTIHEPSLHECIGMAEALAEPTNEELEAWERAAKAKRIAEIEAGATAAPCAPGPDGPGDEAEPPSGISEPARSLKVLMGEVGWEALVDEVGVSLGMTKGRGKATAPVWDACGRVLAWAIGELEAKGATAARRIVELEAETTAAAKRVGELEGQAHGESVTIRVDSAGFEDVPTDPTELAQRGEYLALEAMGPDLDHPGPKAWIRAGICASGILRLANNAKYPMGVDLLVAHIAGMCDPRRDESTPERKALIEGHRSVEGEWLGRESEPRNDANARDAERIGELEARLGAQRSLLEASTWARAAAEVLCAQPEDGLVSGRAAANALVEAMFELGRGWCTRCAAWTEADARLHPETREFMSSECRVCRAHQIELDDAHGPEAIAAALCRVGGG